MGFFSLFRRRRKATAQRKNRANVPPVSATLHRVQADIDQLLGRIGTIDIAIKRHEDQLTEHATRLQEHRDKLQTLEQRVASTPRMTPRPLLRPAAEYGAYTSPEPAQASPARQFDIEQFTEQQKRILAVFFQNKGIRMSYADVAKVLNKSPYTVKNQMNRIRQKADLFDRTIGNQSRNLFTLKADLRIEKYLKVGQPVERPVSMPERDQAQVPSEVEKAEPVIECPRERSEPEDES